MLLRCSQSVAPCHSLNKLNLPPLPTSRQRPVHSFWVPTHANKEYGHRKTQLSMPHDLEGYQQNTGSLGSCVFSIEIGSKNEMMTMQILQIPETAESRFVPKWLFPPQFPDKDRFTFSRPDFVLVTPIAAKTQTQQINVGGWVLRSGRGQLRETESTLAAPPATSRATNPRQHRPKDLSKPRHDIHLVEVKYCEDTRPQNQLNAANKGTARRSLQHSLRSLCYSPHHPFECGRHYLQHRHSAAF